MCVFHHILTNHDDIMHYFFVWDISKTGQVTSIYVLKHRLTLKLSFTDWIVY